MLVKEEEEEEEVKRVNLLPRQKKNVARVRSQMKVIQ
jgi:hypothetical protein